MRQFLARAPQQTALLFGDFVGATKHHKMRGEDLALDLSHGDTYNVTVTPAQREYLLDNRQYFLRRRR